MPLRVLVPLAITVLALMAGGAYLALRPSGAPDPAAIGSSNNPNQVAFTGDGRLVWPGGDYKIVDRQSTSSLSEQVTVSAGSGTFDVSAYRALSAYPPDVLGLDLDEDPVRFGSDGTGLLGITEAGSTVRVEAGGNLGGIAYIISSSAPKAKKAELIARVRDFASTLRPVSPTVLQALDEENANRPVP